MRLELFNKNKLQILCKAGFTIGLIAGAGSPASAAPGPCLSPPTLGDPIQFSGKCPEDPGGPRAVKANGRDVLVELPANRICAKRLSVVKARNVRISGGRFVFNDSQSSVISLGQSSGSAFVDGVHIDVNGRFADAIRTYRHTGELVVQNVRIEGVSGRKSGPHGDIVHAQGGGPLRSLVLQNVSGYTAYQGIFVPQKADSTGHGVRELTLERVNIGYEPDLIVTKPLMLLFIGDNNHAVNKAPDQGTRLTDVYVDGSARNFRFDRAIYARPMPDGVGCATFAPVHGIDGKVCGGPAPGGEFAPAARFGANYDRSTFCSSGATATADRPSWDVLANWMRPR